MKKKLICFVMATALFVLYTPNDCLAKPKEADVSVNNWVENHQNEVDAWAENSAKDIVLNGNVQGRLNKTVQSTVNEALEQLGFEPGTYGNAVYKYIISNDTKGELLSAALEGDYRTMGEKTASLMTEYFAKQITSREGAGNFADILIDGSKGEDVGEMGVNLTKSILKKVFPYIDAMDKFATLCETSRDIWAGDTMEDIYASYKELAGEGNTIRDEEWNRFCTMNNAAFTIYKNKGMTDEQIRDKFAERVLSEDKIAKKEIELKKLIKVWENDNLLTPSINNYSSNYKTIEDRLDSLYKVRQTMITMFTKDGKLQKGSRHLMSDEEFLEYVEFQWISHGVHDRDGFCDWLEEEGIIEKGTFDSLRKNKAKTETSDKKDKQDASKEDEMQGKYIWYLEDVVVESEPSGPSSFNELYSGEYTGSASAHHSHQEFNYDKEHQEADFNMSWSTPPSTAGTDEIITIDFSIQASGNSDLIFSDYLTVYCVEYKGEDTYWNYYSAWTDSDGDYRITVSSSEYSGMDRSGEKTVSGTLGEPYEDTKKTIILASDYSTTYYIYGCRLYDAESVEKAQDLLNKFID